jgi:predicted PurR-regulated permease PerM
MFAGLANLIPYIGPVAGAIPAILITLVQGGDNMMIIKIIIAFSIVQFIDNFLVQPLVLSKTVNLHPLIIVFVVIIGGQFFGLLGMLLAVPVAGIIKVTSRELYIGIKKFHIL